MAEPRETDPRLEAAIDEALSDLATAEPSREFRARVMDRLDGATASGHPVTWALAAAVVAAVLAAVLVLRPEPSPPTPPGRQAIGPPGVDVPPAVPLSPGAGEVAAHVAVRAERRAPVPPSDAGPDSASAGDSIALAAVEIAPIPAPLPLDPPLPLAIPHVTSDRIAVDPISVDRLADTSQEEKR